MKKIVFVFGFLLWIPLCVLFLSVFSSKSSLSSENVSFSDSIDEGRYAPYRGVVNKAILSLRKGDFEEAFRFLQEAQSSPVPSAFTNLLALLDSVSTLLRKKEALGELELERWSEDLKKIVALFKPYRWMEPSVFAQEHLSWAEEQLSYGKTIQKAQELYQKKEKNEAVKILNKIPKEAILLNKEELKEWKEACKREMIKEAQTLIAEYRLAEAQGLLEKIPFYDRDVFELQSRCADNLESANTLATARKYFQEKQWNVALSELKTIPKTSLLFETASQLRENVLRSQEEEEAQEVLLAVKQAYQQGNALEALTLLQKKLSPPLQEKTSIRQLYEKIQLVSELFEQIRYQKVSESPNLYAIREAVQKILNYEKDPQNYYYQETQVVFKEWVLPLDKAHKLLTEAEFEITAQEYDRAKKLLLEVLSIPQLERQGAEKKQARQLLNTIFTSIIDQYLSEAKLAILNQDYRRAREALAHLYQVPGLKEGSREKAKADELFQSIKHQLQFTINKELNLIDNSTKNNAAKLRETYLLAQMMTKEDMLYDQVQEKMKTFTAKVARDSERILQNKEWSISRKIQGLQEYLQSLEFSTLEAYKDLQNKVENLTQQLAQTESEKK
jgi:hypothetical protein